MSVEMKRLNDKQMRDFMSIKGALKLKNEYHKQGGAGFAEDLWKGIIKTGKDVNTFLKNTKLISKGSKLAKYILPAAAGIFGPEVLAGIPIAEKVGAEAEKLGYGCDMKGGAWSVGLSTLGMGRPNTSVLTVARNGQFQVTKVPELGSSGVGYVGGDFKESSKVDAGAPQLSGIMSGLGMKPSNKDALGQYFSIYGQGLGAMNVIASQARIKV